jgi:hypothetical protein
MSPFLNNNHSNKFLRQKYEMCKPHPTKKIKNRTNTMYLVYMMKKKITTWHCICVFSEINYEQHIHTKANLLLSRNNASAQHTE